MAVILDANVLPLVGRGQSTLFDAALLLAREAGHEVLVPALAVEEAAAARKRNMEAAFERALQAVQGCQIYAAVKPPVVPDVEELATEWAARLSEHVRVLDVPDGAAEEGLRRA